MFTTQSSFGLFLALWNRVQGQSTPSVHFRIARWLEAAWDRRDNRLLLMAFRSCGKSTITGLFAAWLLYSNPNLRIMVLAADSLLARKMVRNVKRIVERHPLTNHLRPEKLDQWGSDRFTINRTLELRDPSMIARGLTGNITGSRADVIICDDVEVPRTCDTAEKRFELRDKLAEIEFILAQGGLQLYVGTPHSWFTIYADTARTEIGETEPFLQDFKRLTVPVLDGAVSAWPERFSIEDIDSIKRRSGPNRFASQMMLQPVNIAEGRLDPALLVRYNNVLQMNPVLKSLHLGERQMVSATAWWDPAFGHADGSVLAVVFTDEEGVRYLHSLSYLGQPSPETRGAFRPLPEGEVLRESGNALASKTSPYGRGRNATGVSGEGDDPATFQCRQIVALARKYYLPFIAVEINGIGKFLPAILRRELARANVPCPVREIVSSRAKDIRILEAFDVVLAARLLHVHEDIYKTPFINEMQEWRPGRSGGHDDGLDAVAGALSLEPVRLKRIYPAKGGQGWMTGSQMHTADTDFNV